MKKTSLFFSKLFIIFISFVFALKANAFSSELTMSAAGDSISLNQDNSYTLIRGVTQSTAVYPWFHIKNSNKGRVICLSGFNVSSAPSGSECSLNSSWSNTQDSYAIAYIIDTINKTSASEDLKYWWQEVLINGYYGKLEQEYKAGQRTYDYIIGSSNKILNTGKTYRQLMTAAEAYGKSNFTPSIEVEDKSSANLTFTLADDGYYYSNKITIDSSESYTMGNISNSKFSYTKTGDSYVFKIKESDIKIGTTESFTKKIEISKTQMKASKYECGNSYQDITLDYVETNTNKDSITISGSVTRSNPNIEVKKVDDDNKLLAGVTFELKTEEQHKNNSAGIVKISDGKSNIIFTNLSTGKYYLTETVVPEGYTSTKKTIEITVADTGEITVVGAQIKDTIISIVNYITKTKISKISAVDKKELPGATLEIQDEKGNIVKYCEDEKGNKNTECKWVSTDKPYEIVGLPVGKYYLVETIAPKGYTLNKEKVLFEVKDDGSLTEVVMENNLEVKVPSTSGSRSALLLAIAMFDIALGIGIVTYVKKNKIEQ